MLTVAGTARMTFSASSPRRQLRTRSALSQPALVTIVLPSPSRCGFAVAMQAPLSIAARLNNPAARGEATSMQVSTAPADSPKSMTRAGSPPKAAMLRCTHFSAAIWSMSP